MIEDLNYSDSIFRLLSELNKYTNGMKVVKIISPKEISRLTKILSIVLNKNIEIDIEKNAHILLDNNEILEIESLNLSSDSRYCWEILDSIPENKIALNLNLEQQTIKNLGIRDHNTLTRLEWSLMRKINHDNITILIRKELDFRCPSTLNKVTEKDDKYEKILIHFLMEKIVDYGITDYISCNMRESITIASNLKNVNIFLIDEEQLIKIDSAVIKEEYLEWIK